MRLGSLRRSLGSVAIALMAAPLLLFETPNVAAFSDQSGAPPTAASNQAAAQSDASSLLGKLSLPSDATQSSTEPVGDGGALARPAVYQVTSDLVDDSAWWVASESPAEILSYVEANPPSGSKLGESGGGSSPNGTPLSFDVFGWPPVAGVLSSRWLVITAVALSDGQTGVRADAEDVWIAPRPASEQVPSGVRLVTVTVRQFDGPLSLPLIVGSEAKVTRIIDLADTLPAAQPGVEACPADFGPIVQLAFLSAPGTQPLASLSADSSGCGSVGFSIAGVSQPALADGGSVIDELNTLAVIPVCAAAQLHAAASIPSSEPSGISAILSFRNRSRKACVLSGYPRLRLRGKHGNALPNVIKDDVAGAGATPKVTLAPNASALAAINRQPASSTCKRRRAWTVLILLRHVNRRIIVPVGSAKHPFSPCGLSVGYLAPSP